MDEAAIGNPVIEVIHQHCSARHYTPQPVPPEIVEAIVTAGQRASTSSNLQLYSVIAVTDTALRAELAGVCGNQEQITQAPVFLVWCADLNRLDLACDMTGHEQVTRYVENFLVAAMDAAIAAQTAALAAESLGLGICYIGAIRNHPQAVVQLLRLPRLVFPIAGMTLGWPARTPHSRPRLPIEAVLHWERYEMSGMEDALLRYDQEMVETGIYQGRQVPSPSGQEKVETYGWLEHSARRVSQAARTALRAALAEQGFGLE